MQAKHMHIRTLQKVLHVDIQYTVLAKLYLSIQTRGGSMMVTEWLVYSSSVCWYTLCCEGTYIQQ